MKRVLVLAGPVLGVVGLFWAGRESTHGLSAFIEHWWCPVPLVAIGAGLLCGLLAIRRSRVA